MVADVDRNGRRLMAVVLGGSSGRDRNERAAELLLKGLSGSAAPTGQSILNVANAVGTAPIDMRPNICGKSAVAYVKAQEAAFPMGLKGQPSYLTDQIAAVNHVATDLGRVRTGIVLPRPRPAHIASISSQAIAATPVVDTTLAASLRPGLDLASNPNIPYPRPRPASR